MIDGGQFQGEADAGQAGHRAAVIDLATCRGPRGADDRRREADAGKLVIVPTCRGHRPGKRRGLPAAVPLPTIDAGQAGHRVARGADVPPVPMIDGGKLTPGKLVIVPRSSTWQRAAVPVVSPVPPVVPTIDAGQFQGQADGGQAGHRAAVPVVPTIDGGQLGKPVIDLTSAGAFPRPCACRRSTPGNSASRSSCRPWCRRSTPASSKGKLTAGKPVIVSPVVSCVPTIDAGKRAESGQAGHRAAVPVVPTCRPWCR